MARVRVYESIESEFIWVIYHRSIIGCCIVLSVFTVYNLENVRKNRFITSIQQDVLTYKGKRWLNVVLMYFKPENPFCFLTSKKVTNSDFLQQYKFTLYLHNKCIVGKTLISSIFPSNVARAVNFFYQIQKNDIEWELRMYEIHNYDTRQETSLIIKVVK